MKKFLTLALSAALVALPAFAQSGSGSTQTPSTGSQNMGTDTNTMDSGSTRTQSSGMQKKVAPTTKGSAGQQQRMEDDATTSPGAGSATDTPTDTNTDTSQDQ